MTAPPFAISWTDEAAKVMGGLKRRDPARFKKAQKAVKVLRDVGPSYPSLKTHKYHNMSGPEGEDVWQSYLENQTAQAWRMWWVYGPSDDEITIVSMGPHPD